MPDSFYSSVQKVAEFSGVPWPVVRKVYQQMQSEFLPPDQIPDTEEKSVDLPKSSGRAVWAAHANLTAALLIGLAGANSGMNPKAFAELFAFSVPKRGDGFGRYLRDYISAALVDPVKAALVDYIVFDIDSEVAIIYTTDSKAMEFTLHGNEADDAEEKQARNKRLIRWNGVIDGDLLRKLQATVKWRHNVYPLIRSTEEQD